MVLISKFLKVLKYTSVINVMLMTLLCNYAWAASGSDELSTSQILGEIERSLLSSKKEDNGMKQMNLDITRGSWNKSTTANDAGRNGENSRKGMSMSSSEVEIEDSQALYLLAYNAMQAGQFEVAISIYQKILKKYPNDTYALFGLASAYQSLGQYRQAKPIYVNLLKITPNDNRVVSNLLSIIGEETPLEATYLLSGMADRNPNSSFILAQTSMAYNNVGNYDKAMEYLMRAIINDPNNIQYRYNLAVLFDKTGNYSSAARMYEDVLGQSNMGINSSYSIPVSEVNTRLMYIKSNLL